MRRDFQFALLLALAALPAGMALMAAPYYAEATLKAYASEFFWGGIFVTAILIFVAVIIGLRGEANRPEGGHRQRMIALVGMVVCGAGFLGFAGAYFWPSPLPTHGEVHPSPPSVTPDAIRAAQLQAISTLESDLSKDEMGLRQMFDMQNILEKNIKVQVARIAFRIAGRLEDFKYNNFTEGDGSFIMLAMEGKYHTTASGVALDEGPRDVLFLVTTEKFQRSQKALESFINSSSIPDATKTTLRGFKATVDHDMELMIRIMNSRLNQHDEYFTEYDKVGSQYYKVINNDYATQMTSLRPEADLVSLEIGKILQGGSQAADQTAPSLSAAETAALEGLNNWLCGKDESSLRAEFDLIGILEHNIDLMTKDRGPLTEKQQRFADVFGDPRHVQFTRPLVTDGKYQGGDWKVNPGEIGILVLTERYTASSSQLDSMVRSVLLPQDIKTYLSSLQATVKQNMMLAIDELNDAYKTDPRWIFYAGKTGTIYFAAVRDRYAGKLIPLRPKVDVVCGLISTRLRTGTR